MIKSSVLSFWGTKNPTLYSQKQNLAVLSEVFILYFHHNLVSNQIVKSFSFANQVSFAVFP